MLVSPQVPNSLLTCKDAPTAPNPDAKPAPTDSVVASYLVDLFASWQDCSSNLAGVKQVLDSNAKLLGGSK